MSPYHHLEGNIEVSNPFYSGLMLERKSIDGFESLGTSSFGKTILTKKPEKLATHSTNPFLVSQSALKSKSPSNGDLHHLEDGKRITPFLSISPSQMKQAEPIEAPPPKKIILHKDNSSNVIPESPAGMSLRQQLKKRLNEISK